MAQPRRAAEPLKSLRDAPEAPRSQRDAAHFAPSPAMYLLVALGVLAAFHSLQAGYLQFLGRAFGAQVPESSQVLANVGVSTGAATGTATDLGGGAASHRDLSGSAAPLPLFAQRVAVVVLMSILAVLFVSMGARLSVRTRQPALLQVLYAALALAVLIFITRAFGAQAPADDDDPTWMIAGAAVALAFALLARRQEGNQQDGGAGPGLLMLAPFVVVLAVVASNTSVAASEVAPAVNAFAITALLLALRTPAVFAMTAGAAALAAGRTVA